MPSTNLKLRCLSAGLATLWLGSAQSEAPAQVSGGSEGGGTVRVPVQYTKKTSTVKKASKKTKKTTENANQNRVTSSIPDIDPASPTLQFVEEIDLNPAQPLNILNTNIFALAAGSGEGASGDVMMLFNPAVAGSIVFGTTTWNSLFTSNQAAIAAAIDAGDAMVLSDFLFESSSRTGVISAIAVNPNTPVMNSLQGVMVGFDGTTGIAFDNGFIAFDAQVVPEPVGLMMVAGVFMTLSVRRR